MVAPPGRTVASRIAHAVAQDQRHQPTVETDRDRLPQRRRLVRFDYLTLSGPGSSSWLLIERGDAEICETYPGGDEHLIVVVHDPVAFARWHLGEIEWFDALRAGTIEVTGSREAASR